MRDQDPITVQTVAGDDTFLVTSHLGRSGSDELVVCFGYQGTGIAPTGFGIDFLTQRGYDAVYVANRWKSSYQGLSAGMLADVLAPLLQGRKVFTYGSSLGGYCALYYAGVLSARALALSPRNVLYPRDPEGFDPAAHPEWTHHLHLTDVPRSPHRPTIVFDNMHPRDSSFVRTWALPAYPDAREVHVPLSGHDTGPRLHAMGKLKGLVLAMLRDEALPDRIDGFPEGSAQLATVAFREAMSGGDPVQARAAAFGIAGAGASSTVLKHIWKFAMAHKDLELSQQLVNAAGSAQHGGDLKAMGILRAGRKMGLTPTV